MHPTPLLRTVRADLDWQELRFPGESELRREITNIPNLLSSLDAWSDPKRFSAVYPPGYLAGGMVATAEYAPAIYRIGILLRRILRLTTEVEVHLYPSQQWLIDVLPRTTAAAPSRRISENMNPSHEDGEALAQMSRDEPVRLAITAPVAERLWAKESLFALGRKLGRLLLDQIPLCLDPSVGGDSKSRHVLLARGIWRFQELSCDRIGALCCQDNKAAMRALLKSASGLPANLLHLDRNGTLGMRLHEEAAMLSPWENDFIQLRLLALQRFFESNAYQKAFDQVSPAPRNRAEASTDDLRSPLTTPGGNAATAPSILSFPQLDDTPPPIEQNPACVERKSNIEPTKADGPRLPSAGAGQLDAPDEIRRTFALNAALWLISLRDGVGDAEREALTDLFGPRFLDEVKEAYEVRGAQVFEESARSLAREVSDLELDDRMSLLRDLIHVAMSAGRLKPSEHTWLVDLAGIIDIPAGQASVITAEFMDPEFADYEFRKGEDVEVLLDGEWMSGTVLDIDHTGDLKIEFASDHDVLRLNPTADLIRPTIAKRA